jgi:hypothetical protein
MEGLTPLLQDIFVFQRRGRDGRRVVGDFTPTGIVPRLVSALRDQGEVVPLDLFQAASGSSHA